MIALPPTDSDTTDPPDELTAPTKSEAKGLRGKPSGGASREGREVISGKGESRHQLFSEFFQSGLHFCQTALPDSSASSLRVGVILISPR